MGQVILSHIYVVASSGNLAVGAWPTWKGGEC